MMNLLTEIDPKVLDENVFKLIGEQWMLVTAGNAEKFNMMTASWGGLGFLWNRPVAFVFIRPQRYTFDFVERNEGFTLSFFGEEYRKVLQLCGTKSGREIDKVAETKLTPFATPSGNMAFEEASFVLDCRKCYTDMIEKGNFIDYETVARWYPHEDFHKMYVAEIIGAWRR